MRALFLFIAVSLAVPVVATAQAPVAEASKAATDVPLKLKVYRNWSIRLPAEQWASVGTKFAFEEGQGAEFKAHLDGTALAVDVDGDGAVDVKIEGPSGHVILVNGERRYALRLRKMGELWEYAPAGAMTGVIEGRRVRLIDQNGNGRFDDVGKDAMIVGRGKAASLLSRVISVDAKLYDIEVAADGRSLRYTPYQGPVATLDLEATTKGKVLAAVVTSTDGRHSFGFSSGKAQVTVPAGEYALHSGTISFGGNTVRMKTGRARPVTLVADGTGHLQWGGPVRAEFTYASSGRELTFDPNAIWFYGASGEEYYGWNPLGKSPKISLHAKSGREIAQAYFPGSC